jgi:hypothetical protein
MGRVQADESYLGCHIHVELSRLSYTRREILFFFFLGTVNFEESFKGKNGRRREGKHP